MDHNTPLIGLCGHIGVGKDAIGSLLVSKYGYTRTAFADALKIEAAFAVWFAQGGAQGRGKFKRAEDVLAYMEAHKRDGADMPSGWGRLLLQAWGTMARDLAGEDYWVGKVALAPGTVVTDVRYANEARAIWKVGGLVVKVERPGHTGDGHQSEMFARSLVPDWTIHNDGTLDDLERHVDDMLDHLRALDEVLRKGVATVRRE